MVPKVGEASKIRIIEMVVEHAPFRHRNKQKPLSVLYSRKPSFKKKKTVVLQRRVEQAS